METMGEETGRIAIVETTLEQLVLEHLEIALPGECATLDADPVAIHPGERVQILGKPGAGKSSLFRALAGMWPWGSGTIQLPPRQSMSFMPPRPYLPAGTLRAAVTYPAAPDRFEAATMTAALHGVDLGHLVPLLDRVDRWDRELPLDEQQRLAFVRLLLHKPRWVILDDALDAVSESHRRLVLSLAHRELEGAALVRLGRDPVLDGFWDRTINIVERPGGPRLHARTAPKSGAPSRGR
jgi:putative ATP-binding cassette transporter